MIYNREIIGYVRLSRCYKQRKGAMTDKKPTNQQRLRDNMLIYMENNGGPDGTRKRHPAILCELV